MDFHKDRYKGTGLEGLPENERKDWPVLWVKADVQPIPSHPIKVSFQTNAGSIRWHALFASRKDYEKALKIWVNLEDASVLKILVQIGIYELPPETIVEQPLTYQNAGSF
jgi:hypothetical protein